MTPTPQSNLRHIVRIRLPSKSPGVSSSDSLKKRSAAALAGTAILMGRSLEVGTATLAGDALSLLAGLLPAWRAMQVTPAIQLKSQ